jgi:hypothetical protein
MFRRLLLLVVIFSAFSLDRALSQNWSENIAPIFYEKCTQCHRAGGIAPTNYMDYSDVVQDAATIRVKVQQGVMPPWPPDTGYNRFAHERSLTQQQISDIVSWVQNGTPLGDTTLAPARPVYSGQGEIANPDMVLRIPTYTLSNTANDEYRCFVLPTGLSAQQFINEMEVIPGNLGVVHHVLIFSDTSNVPAQRDAQDPGPGYAGFGGTGSNSSQLIGVWAPGGSSYKLPVGMGIKLPANTNIILQVHYPVGFGGQVDSTQFRVKFSTTPFTREVFISSPLNHFQLDNGPLVIPPNSTPTFTAHYTLPFNVTVLGLAPHMHLLGRSITSFGITPSNDTVPFVHIPTWDFHWQDMYSFPRVLTLPAGTTLYSSATYDNTINNPNNPNDPPAWTFLGEATTDEMMLVYFLYTYYLPGDENIIQDTSFFAGTNSSDLYDVVKTPQLYDPAPNPANDKLTIEYYLPKSISVSLTVTDIQGRVIVGEIEEKELSMGAHRSQIDVSMLPAGNYIVVLATNSGIRHKKIIVAR